MRIKTIITFTFLTLNMIFGQEKFETFRMYQNTLESDLYGDFIREGKDSYILKFHEINSKEKNKKGKLLFEKKYLYSREYGKYINEEYITDKTKLPKYSKDKNDKIIKEEYFYVNGDLMKFTNYFYDKEGNLNYEIEYDNEKRLNSKTFYYFSFPNLNYIKKIYFDGENDESENNKQYQFVFYKYDKSSRPIEEITVNSASSINKKIRKYNEMGLLIEEIDYDKVCEKPVYNKKIEYLKFDEKKNWTIIYYELNNIANSTSEKYIVEREL